MLSVAAVPLTSWKTTCSLPFGVGDPAEKDGFVAGGFWAKGGSPVPSGNCIALGGVNGEVEVGGPDWPFGKVLGG